MTSVQISTLRILGIFLCKQAIALYLRKDSKAVMIRKTPYIIWNEHKTKENSKKKKQTKHDRKMEKKHGDGDDDTVISTTKEYEKNE